MRTELVKELKETILSKIGADFNDPSSTFFKPYPEPDEDDWMVDDYNPEEVFNKDNVIATIEWELGDIFIEGLSEDEIKLLKGGE